MKTIRFSGYDWTVKSSRDRVGPGSNYFSDSSENVWVDSRGRLHLRITKRGDRWYCAEVVSKRSFGYGTYRFHLAALPDEIDPKVVLGLFTWNNEPAYHHREIDVELSHWGEPDTQLGQFVVQPYTDPKNISRFPVPLPLPASTQSFTWTPSKVTFLSTKRSAAASSGPDAVIHKWTATNGIPRAGGENARMNLWLMREPGQDEDRQTEVIIDRFAFEPSRDQPAKPRLEG
ncbi:MAG TPA: glycoside hydrolase family 16 protein [Armatimonadota bacterium]